MDNCEYMQAVTWNYCKAQVRMPADLLLSYQMNQIIRRSTSHSREGVIQLFVLISKLVAATDIGYKAES